MHFWWHANVSKINDIGSQVCKFSYNEPLDLHVFCDASETCLGGHLITGSEDEHL